MGLAGLAGLAGLMALAYRAAGTIGASPSPACRCVGAR